MLKSRPVLPAVVIALVLWMVLGAVNSRNPRPRLDSAKTTQPPADLSQTVQKVDAELARIWAAEKLSPAAPADDLQVLRRLHLALVGTVPSLEEIRQFEADTGPDRLERWTERLLTDLRYYDYFAERLARGFVGTDFGQFIIYRRDRFVNWLRDQLEAGTPYDELVRHMIADTGLWTGVPATNFISAAVANEVIDQNKLAGRTVRAFLGQRIDCAQCHDHPFDHWKQAEFAGIAAYYGQVRTTLVGMQDLKGQEFKVTDRKTSEEVVVAPQVPFSPEWDTQQGSRRERLAAWVTHPDNRRFERAIANRVWGLMFGKAYLEPVDGLPDPVPGQTDLLDILGADFREHGYDLRRLIRVIVASRAFRLDSAHPSSDEQVLDHHTEHWAVFPLLRLRPEQVIGSILQGASLSTIDRNSSLFIRAIRFFRENDFVKEYGDLGEEELSEQSGTVPQALLRMNGRLTREILGPNPFSATGRIAQLTPTDEACVETAFLITFTRRPSSEELSHFSAMLKGSRGDRRAELVEDLLWSLCNSPEFSWNH